VFSRDLSLIGLIMTARSEGDRSSSADTQTMTWNSVLPLDTRIPTLDTLPTLPEEIEPDGNGTLLENILTRKFEEATRIWCAEMREELQHFYLLLSLKASDEHSNQNSAPCSLEVGRMARSDLSAEVRDHSNKGDDDDLCAPTKKPVVPPAKDLVPSLCREGWRAQRPPPVCTGGFAIGGPPVEASKDDGSDTSHVETQPSPSFRSVRSSQSFSLRSSGSFNVGKAPPKFAWSNTLTSLPGLSRSSTLSSFKFAAVARVVKGKYFDWVVCGLIVLNAIFIGIQTDMMARTVSPTSSPVFRTVETVFCALFLCELALRLYVHGTRFFYKSGWQWNMFDFILVGLQLIELIFSIIWSASGSGVVPRSVGFARVLRILRLVRVIRVARILRLIRELRMLVSSINNSLKSLLWTVMLLMLIIYLVSIYLTQLVSDHRASTISDHEKELAHYYGSLGRTMLSLFESVTNGISWDVLVNPLIQDISPGLALLFALYIAFTMLAMMNVVTGVFVDSVMQSAKSDKDMMLLMSTRELFTSEDGNLKETVNYEEFKDKLDTKGMKEFFKHINVDQSEAHGVFSLLDTDDNGTIQPDEFLHGCVRLRGPAKALDTAVIKEQVHRLSRLLKSHLRPADCPQTPHMHYRSSYGRSIRSLAGGDSPWCERGVAGA